MSEWPRSDFQSQTETARPRLPVVIEDECGIVDGPNGGVNSSHDPGVIAHTGRWPTPAARAGESKLLPPRQEFSSSTTARIAIRSKGRILLIEPIEIVSVQAQGSYVLLQRQTCSHLLRGSISTMAEKLRPYGFIRIHRSVLINSAHVEEVRSLRPGEYGVRVRLGKTYSVSRRYNKNLRLLAELWLGACP